MICIIYNKKKEGTGIKEHLDNVTSHLRVKKKPFIVLATYPYFKKDLAKIKSPELFVSIGGDGTVLSCMPLLLKYKKPLIPLNFGKVGFISSIPIRHSRRILDLFFRGDLKKIKIEKRNFIEIHTSARNYYALNDFVITKGMSPRLFTYHISIAGKNVISVRADGVIFSTATGSTAYNLSADGPILHPNIRSIIFNPICPHSLTAKPVIMQGDDRISIRVTDIPKGFYASFDVDGILRKKLRNNEVIRCRLSKETVSFVKLASENYYLVLKEKLKWGI
ncbi:NAD(+)/NADH kinase [Spirochaetota bacterium]